MSATNCGAGSIPLSMVPIVHVVPQTGLMVLDGGRVVKFNEIYGYTGQYAQEIGITAGAVVGVCGNKIFAGIGGKT